MTNLTPTQAALSESWRAIHTGSGQAIEWIENVRRRVPSVENEADALTIRLRRARNLASSLSRVAGTPMTIGFFGLSQAGKSYLISSLAAGTNGRLETDYGSQRLDFILHVNPVGNGKEATGLVTRFSRTAKAGTGDYPVELKLFSEVEIAKILGNAYFNDFDQDRRAYKITDERVAAMLARAEDRKNATPQAGVDADDVVALWDYLRASFANSIDKLEHQYWPRVCKLAPYLRPDDRAELFSVLWGEEQELTRVYVQLAATLSKLSSADTAFAPVSALMKSTGEGTYSQADSIMNVDILERLGSSRDVNIEVRASVKGQVQPPVSVQVSHLAALTAELIFPLVNETQDPRVETVDLLDFPGYRGRMKIVNVQDAAGSSTTSDGNPAAQLILRGKVAYLFERYTDSQEMNGLVLCTAADKQSDVNGVEPVLTRWIERTQGKTAKERGGRRPGLIWAVTMFDKRIQAAEPLSDSQLAEGWEGLVKMTMLERFGNCQWMKDWTQDLPFNNTFLVRKPRLKVSFLQLDNGVEAALDPQMTPKLDAMRASFVVSESVRKHVADPEGAWDAMLSLNNGGMGRLAESVGAIATLDFKLNRIQEQLDQTYHDVVATRLEPLYHQEGADEAVKKKAVATKLWSELSKVRQRLPELMGRLELSNEVLRDIYLSGADMVAGQHDDLAEDGEDVSAAPVVEDDPFGALGDEGGFDIDPFATAVAPAPVAKKPTVVLQTAEHRFARAVYQAWIAHLRDVPNRSRLLELLRIEKSTAEALVDELVTAATRLNVQQRLEDSLLRRADSGSKREQMAMRQVLRVQTVLRDFIAWTDFLRMPAEERPNSLIDRKDKLFTCIATLDDQGLPQLPAEAADLNREFMGYWLTGLTSTTVANAGAKEGRKLTAEQNEALGRVLRSFK